MIFGRDHDQPYRDFRVRQLSGSVSSGSWSVSIEVFGDADIAEFPELAMVVLFTEDMYGDEQISIGGDYCHRENIVFVGYILQDSVRYAPGTGNVEFSAMSITGLMNKMVAWPANFTVTGTVQWHKIQGMIFDAAASHILSEHTTIDHIADIYPSRDTKELRAVDISEASIFDQLDRQLYSAVGVRVLSNSQGMIYCEHDPQLMLESDRNAVGETMTVLGEDVSVSVSLGTEHHVRQACQVVLSSFGYDDSGDLVGYESIAPATQTPFGTVRKLTGRRVDTQEEANALADVLWRYENVEFDRVGLSFAGNYRVFDIAPMEYCRLPVHGAENLRGIRWNSARLLPRDVSLRFEDSGVVRADVTLEKDSFEPEGVIGDFPSLYELSDLLGPDAAEEGVTGPPICDFDAWPTAGVGDSLKVQFYDMTEGCDIESWAWDFGDGSATGIEQNPQHTYTGPTGYDVKLIVENAWGTCSIERTDFVQLTASRSAFEKLSTLNCSAGENKFECAVIDTGNTNAYFGTDTSPGIVVKVNIAGVPTRTSAVTLTQNKLWCAAIDTANELGWFCTYTDPAWVVRVDLNTMTEETALQLQAGESLAGACVLDSNEQYLYVGCQTSPAIIVKVNASATPMTRVGALSLSASNNSIWGAAIDTSDTYTYWACYTSPGRLVRVGLAAFTEQGTIVCAPAEYGLAGLTIDDNDAYVYAGSYYGRQVVKFRLSDFTRLGGIRLQTGEDYLETALYDSVGSHVFLASLSSPASIIKVDAVEMERIVAAYAAVADAEIGCGVIDAGNGYTYWGTLSSPGRVLRFGTGD